MSSQENNEKEIELQLPFEKKRETIPHKDHLYLRVHKVNIDFNVEDQYKKILPVAFDMKGDDGLSVDWSEHSKPEETLSRANKPEQNGILSFNCGDVRKSPFSCEVIHDPIENINYAHSLVCGIPPRKPNGLEFRIQLRQICKWEIQCINK